MGFLKVVFDLANAMFDVMNWQWFDGWVCKAVACKVLKGGFEVGLSDVVLIVESLILLK